MISSLLKEVLLGYSQTGGRMGLRVNELRGRLLILGARANDMASLFAYASHEAGLRPLILDLDGHLSSRVSGYFPAHRVADILYDLYRMDDRVPRWHGELLSSAYAAALDLTTEEEAILDAATQQLASQDTMASPSAVYDALSGVEGFRGFYVDKLKGRIGTLKYLDAADSLSMDGLLSQAEAGGSVINFADSSMPRATQLGAALFVAKLIAATHSIPDERLPSFVMTSSIHQVFKALPKPVHGNRLFTAMLSSPLTNVLASDQAHALSPLITQACPMKILSADAWNQTERERRRWKTPYDRVSNPVFKQVPPVPPPVLPNSFVFEDGFFGLAVPFVPRPYEARVAIAKSAPGRDSGRENEAAGPPPTADSELTKRVLQEVQAYESPSMSSVVSFLSAEFQKDLVQAAIDKLEKEGFLRLSPKQQKSGRTMLALELTPAGAELLGGMA